MCRVDWGVLENEPSFPWRVNASNPVAMLSSCCEVIGRRLSGRWLVFAVVDHCIQASSVLSILSASTSGHRFMQVLLYRGDALHAGTELVNRLHLLHSSCKELAATASHQHCSQWFARLYGAFGLDASIRAAITKYPTGPADFALPFSKICDRSHRSYFPIVYSSRKE